jgi:hypothetical protein
MSSSILVRAKGRAIAVVRSATAQGGRTVQRVVGRLSRAQALAGELPSPLRAALSDSEAMQLQIALVRWRRDDDLERRGQRLAQAAQELEALAELFAGGDELSSASELMAAVEQYRLRSVVAAWQALGHALRQRARRHGLEALFDRVADTAPAAAQADDDPVVIASEHADTATLSQRDAERLRRVDR